MPFALIERVDLPGDEAVEMLEEAGGVVELLGFEGEAEVEVVDARLEPVEAERVSLEGAGDGGADDVDGARDWNVVVLRVECIGVAAFVEESVLMPVVGEEEKLPVDATLGAFVDEMRLPATDPPAHGKPPEQEQGQSKIRAKST